MKPVVIMPIVRNDCIHVSTIAMSSFGVKCVIVPELRFLPKCEDF